MKKWKRNIIINAPYYMWALLCFILMIQAIPTLEMDMWGFDSIYMHKVLFFMLFGEILYLRKYLRTPKKIREKLDAVQNNEVKEE